jgi:hypothetical protein
MVTRTPDVVREVLSMKALRWLFVLVVSFGLVSAAAAADDKTEKKPAKKGTPGLVEKFDYGTKTLTIKTGKKNDPAATTLNVIIDDQTKITVQSEEGTKPGKVEDVAGAKRVMVKKETKDGKEFATEVVVILGKKKTS